MNPSKTTILRFRPIAEITEEEAKNEILVFNGVDYWNDTVFLDVIALSGITHYAVLPKDE